MNENFTSGRKEILPLNSIPSERSVGKLLKIPSTKNYVCGIGPVSHKSVGFEYMELTRNIFFANPQEICASLY
jgi:hypothetical protein